MNKKNNYIWLFGENLGKTANNNSFYFWKHIINKKKDNINKYIILEKNSLNKKVYETLNKREKESVVWKNSLKHFILFFLADMYFVTLSYKDIRPEQFMGKKYEFQISRPVIYLQHGITAIKKLGYKGNSYWNNMFRFIYYNKIIKQQLIEENDFRKYQLYYGIVFPRFKELVRKNNLELKKGIKSKQILWFLTWREYKEDSFENQMLIKKINHVLRNEKLNKYLHNNKLKIKLCLHQLYKTDAEEFMKNVNKNNIELAYATEINLMEEIVKSNMLITDYSSLGFDFTFLKKPVVLFQPDREEYLSKRQTYCTIDELEDNSIDTESEFIDIIINEKYRINEFFNSRITDVEFEKVEKGYYIDRMYKYFKKKQEEKITFLGYNFYGVGGTVNATRALAEGLLENGYMVEMLSLKNNGKAKNMPYALNLTNIDMYMNFDNFKIKRWLWSNIYRNYKYLNFDTSKKYLEPYTGVAIEKILNRIKSKTVISTRETLHLFLEDTNNKKIKNKIYFFHCQAEIIDEIFPGIMGEINKRKLTNTVFVTEKNKNEYIKKQQYDNYERSLVLGNALERKNVRNINKIEVIPEKEKYYLIYLLRISQERKCDIENLIEFGKYLKEKNIKNIVVDVFGDGDYVENFVNELVDNELTNFIKYKGKTNDSTYHIRRHDALVDFTLNHSFGMTYIEGILSGKSVYCMKNTGSIEVMEGIPNSFIESYEDLVNKINKLPTISVEQLQENYRKIEEKYSRKIIAKKFIEYIDRGAKNE